MSKSNYFHNVETGLDNISFELTGVNTHIANAIRRSILSEIPMYGFEDEPKKVFSHLKNNGLPIPRGIHISENTTSLHNEFLAHRIGLLPVYTRRPISSEFNTDILDRVYTPSTDLDKIKKLEDRLMSLPMDSSDREVVLELLQEEREMPLFTLDITNNSKTRSELKNGKYFKNLGREKRVDVPNNDIVRVTSDMFHTKNGDEMDYIKYDPCIYEAFKNSKGEGREEYAVIVTLKPGIEADEGQTLKVDVSPSIGIGRNHSKYCPVGTVSYSFKRDENPERIRRTFEELITKTNRTREMKGLDPLPSDLFDASGEMTNENEEVLKLWRNYEILDRDRIYEIEDGIPKYFCFNVESVGSLEPYQIVHDALYMLRLRLIDIYKYVGDTEVEYVEITRAKSVMKGVDIILHNENHTMGNLITGSLNEEPKIDFAGYKMPHPLHEKIVFRITLKESSDLIADATAIFKDSIYKIILELGLLIDDWCSQNKDVYKRILDTTTEEFLNEDAVSKKSIKSTTSSVGSKKPRKVRVKKKKSKK